MSHPYPSHHTKHGHRDTSSLLYECGVEERVHNGVGYYQGALSEDLRLKARPGDLCSKAHLGEQTSAPLRQLDAHSLQPQLHMGQEQRLPRIIHKRTLGPCSGPGTEILTELVYPRSSRCTKSQCHRFSNAKLTIFPGLVTYARTAGALAMGSKGKAVPGQMSSFHNARSACCRWDCKRAL